MDEVLLNRLSALRLVSFGAHRANRRGERRGKGVGGRMEFADHRPYFPGDDLRRVDWNAVARSDRVVVKRHVAESALPVLILIDVSRSMTVGEPSPLDAAKRMARALAYVALSHGDTATLAPISERGEPLRTAGVRALPRVERYLSELTASDATNFARSLRGYAARQRSEGLAIVLSDLLDPRGFEDGFRAISRRELVVAHLVSPQLWHPDPPPEARITDAETGATREIAWNADSRAAFESKRDAFFERAERFAAARAIRYVRVRTDSNLSDVLLKTFRQARILA